MLLSELVPAVKELERADKLRLMQLLVMELAREDDVPLLSTDIEYPIHTPLNAFEAGDTLLKMLEGRKEHT
jgi:hypothetical protein